MTLGLAFLEPSYSIRVSDSELNLQLQWESIDMIRILIAASVFTLGLGAAAIAQETDGSKTVKENSATANAGGSSDAWFTSMGNMFFSDDEGMTMRSDEDLRTNYGKLTDQQKAEMKEECGSLAGNSASAGNRGHRANTGPMSDLCKKVGTM